MFAMVETHLDKTGLLLDANEVSPLIAKIVADQDAILRGDAQLQS